MSSADELYIADDNGYNNLRIRLLAGRPLGAAKTDETQVGGGVAGILRNNGAAQIASRFLVVGPASMKEEVCSTLTRARRTSTRHDPAWITLSPECATGQYVVFVLTRAQVEAVDGWLPPLKLRLANHQEIETIDVNGDDWWERKNTYEMVPWKEDVSEIGRYGEGTIQLQGAPSAPFAGRLGSPNSYFCVINPAHKPRLGRGFVLVINPYLEEDYRGLIARFPVLIRYRNEVSSDNIILDETIQVAIGVRPGEPILVQRGPRSKVGRRRILSFRHTLCRAIPASTLDMEKPVARISSAVFDILGVTSGSRIVVEGSSEQARGRLSKVQVRALEERGHRLPLNGGVPDILDTIGSVDLPEIALDLANRNALGISTGGAVYVRPALGSIFADEFTKLSLALLAAIVGSVASERVAITVILTVIYVLLTGGYIIRRLR